MKTSVLWAFALLFLASNMQAEGFEMPGFSKLKNTLSENFGKLKDKVTGHMAGMSSPAEKFTSDLMTKMTENFGGIKDEEALADFVKHMMHIHADLTLKNHHELSKLMVTHLKALAGDNKIFIPSNTEWEKVGKELRSFAMDEFVYYHQTLNSFLKKHEIRMDPEEAQMLLEAIMKKTFLGGDVTEIMESAVRKFDSKITKANLKTVMDDFKSQMDKVSQTSQNKLNSVLKSNGLNFPTNKLADILNEMIRQKLTMTIKTPKSIEETLKQQFNHAMGLMHKAMGDAEPDKIREVMESIRAKMPQIFEEMMRKMKMKMEKNGKKMSTEEFMNKIRSHTSPKDHDKKKRHHHHKRHHRKRLIIAISSSIGALTLIGIISVIVYILCKQKRKAPRKSVYIEKPPPEKINPYDNLDRPKTVSIA